MDDLIPTSKYKDTHIPAVIIVIANFPKATKEKPALLKHGDVETFFHEFGHAMHGMLGQTCMRSFSGTNVKRDFVEMPSQMFEEWMWDKAMLKMVSSHYKTGEPLSDDIINKKLAMKKLVSGYFVTRQCVLSLLALAYFDKGGQKDVDAIHKNLWEQYIPRIAYQDDTHFQCAFGHLMGYGAKYYSYMWSKVFAMDMFEQVKKAGLMDASMGQKLIREVIGKGGSKDPNDLIKAFLGREPSQEAFLKDIGV